MFSGKYEWSGDREAGDCSIRIFDASEVDDGDWECQVTASSFTAHDALTSRIAELVVRGKGGSCSGPENCVYVCVGVGVCVYI